VNVFLKKHQVGQGTYGYVVCFITVVLNSSLSRTEHELF